MNTLNNLEEGSSGFTATSTGCGHDLLTYSLFERKHNLLKLLTLRQLDLIELIAHSSPHRILNIGCDTGISATVLYKKLSSGQPSKIFALDTSNPLFLKEKNKCEDTPGLYFVQGDAENIKMFFQDEGFDGIFYAPSLFQVPNLRKSLRQASNLIVPGGVVSTCHFLGLFSEDGEDIIMNMFPESHCSHDFFHRQRQDLESILGPTSGFRSTSVDFQFEAESEFLEDFLSILIQMHPLYPKMSHAEHIPKLQEIRSIMEWKDSRGLFIGWKFFIAQKERRLSN